MMIEGLGLRASGQAMCVCSSRARRMPRIVIHQTTHRDAKGSATRVVVTTLIPLHELEPVGMVVVMETRADTGKWISGH